MNPARATELLPRRRADGRGEEPPGIDLSWLLRLRWGAIAGQVVTIALAHAWLRVELPLLPLAALVGAEAASNVACARWLARTSRVGPGAVAAVMALDFVLLTGLLACSGGPSNPFSSLYLVNIALAAVLLPAAWTWLLVALALGCFAALFLVHAPAFAVAPQLDMHSMHGQLHLEGMWVAFGVAASFIVYFVQRVTRALADRERQLDDARAATGRAERLASLATLAAGAAHELSTPLSTIAVVAKEIERELERLGVGEGALSDARLVRDQVERCRDILVQMAADAGESTGEDFSAITIAALVESSIDGLAERERVALALAPGDDRVVVPVRSVAQALRAVAKNALQASPRQSQIMVAAGLASGSCRIEVRDSGPGMSPEVLARAGEPFFTTKATGQGMGLGLFLARAVLDRLGGRLELRSAEGLGTTVVLHVPAQPSLPLHRGLVPAQG